MPSPDPSTAPSVASSAPWPPSVASSPRAVDIDPWDPWPDGRPRLRVDSYTARQLSYMSRQAVHLENRRIFIGDFPRDWIEQNGQTWLVAVHKAMDRLVAADSGRAGSGSPGASPEPDMPPLDYAPRERSDSPIMPVSSATPAQRVSASMHAAGERNIISEITAAAEHNDRAVLSERKSIAAMRRHLRQRFKRHTLRAAPMEVVSDEASQLHQDGPTLPDGSTPSGGPAPSEIPTLSEMLTDPPTDAGAPLSPPSLSPTKMPREAWPVTDAVQPAEPRAAARTATRTKASAALRDLPPTAATSSGASLSPSAESSEETSQETRAATPPAPRTKVVPASRSASPCDTAQEVTPELRARKRMSSFSSSSQSTCVSLKGAPASERLSPHQRPPANELPPASEGSGTLRSAASTTTEFFDCEEELPASKPGGWPEGGTAIEAATHAASDAASKVADRVARKAYLARIAAGRPLVAIASPPIAAVHSHPDDVFSDATSDDEAGEDEAIASAAASTTATSRSGYTERSVPVSLGSRKSRGIARLKQRAQNVHLRTHRKRELVYQGRYLVEVRESAAGKPVVSETDAPLATSLVRRWKEYAVFAKYTGDVRRPLCLYFYDAIKDMKLTRRVRRSWSRSLDFKVVVDPFYELKIFSALDLTLALWRPHVVTEHGRREHAHERKRKTKVIILHSQSIMGIWDLAFLLGAVVQGGRSRQISRRVIGIGVPKLDVEVKVMIDSLIRRFKDGPQPSTMTYDELLDQLVATSPTVRLIIDKIASAIMSLPRQYKVSTMDREKKMALAWQQSNHSHRQLWMPSMMDEMTFMTRLLWLMEPCGGLKLLTPEPKCYEGDLVEPPPVEGFCLSVEASTGKPLDLKARFGQQYIATHDHLLFYVSGARAEPPMLASGQSTMENTVDPYPLDENGDIRWIKESTCMREIDYHDTIARLELERRINMVSNSRGFIDLRYTEKIFTDENVPEQLVIKEKESYHHRLVFPSKEQADIWAKRLNDVVEYWRCVHSAELLRRVVGTNKPMSVTPYVANRTILYNGPLFFKKHRFSTFKRYPTVLTLKGLVVFRISESSHRESDPNSPAPAGTYDFRQYATYSLEDSYVYTGQLARHALVDNDKHIDPNNPGVRSLPRAYEDSWVSQDTELDRCFVIWRPRTSHLQRFVRSAGTGSYLAFLTRDKHERDHWVTAIRYVQSELAAQSRDQVAAEEFDDGTDLADISLTTSRASSVGTAPSIIA